MWRRKSSGMRCGTPCLRAPIVLFSALQLLLLLDGSSALVPQEENILESLRLELNQPSWTGDPCDRNISWIGCSADSQQVVGLNLANLNLKGPIPTQVAEFGHLQRLFMQQNRLSGSVPDLSNITGLVNLDLNTNNLSGKLLHTANFTNLTRLVLNDNNFIGGIPADLFKHPTLQLLYLGNNPLGGPLPNMTELTSMVELSLFNISLNGTIPESIQSMTQVKQVVLFNNPQLMGSIPNLSALVNLQYLDLSSCSLTGPLPDLKNAPGVLSVKLQLNDLSGTIPPELFEHPQLIFMNLNNNSRISGEIPDTSQMVEVTNFFLNDCNLTGPIPPLQNNVKLQYVSLKNNHLTSCPPDLQNLTELVNFDVGNNSISGSLPEFYASDKIQYLVFRRNKFSGGIPMSWTKLTGVKEFQVEHNNLNGSLQKEIGDVVSLKVILLNDNRLSGPIPKELGRLNQLEILDLSDNQFSGTVPEELAALPNLIKLILHNNDLEGLPEVFIKLRNEGLNLTYDANVRIIGGKSKSRLSGGVIAGVVIGLALIAVSTVIAFLLFRRKTRNREDRISKDELPKSTQAFSLREIKAITNKYKTVLGKGGYGTVYYGKLPDGKEVAVKVRGTGSKQGVKEFLNEVRLLSRLHHRNLVPLVGYSLEGGQQTLIYAYMAEGTLHDHLYGKGKKLGHSLCWKTRLDIAINAAKGLEYLHKDCSPPVIHRDVKASNILLTQNLQARISDLGISKQLPEPQEEESDMTGVSTAVKGTFGYLDPEYFVRHRLTTKSDVYSFGMLLLEIITGKPPQCLDFPDGRETILTEWVEAAVRKEQVDSIIDPALGSDYDKMVVLKVLKTALSCVRHDSAERPDMEAILLCLTEAFEAESKLVNQEESSRTVPDSGQLSTSLGSLSFDKTWSPFNTETAASVGTGLHPR